MNSKNYRINTLILVLTVLVISLFIFSLQTCNVFADDEETKYTVTVNGGRVYYISDWDPNSWESSTEYSFAPGDTVKIEYRPVISYWDSETEDGFEDAQGLDHWEATGIDLDDSSALAFSFIMPDNDVELTAVRDGEWPTKGVFTDDTGTANAYWEYENDTLRINGTGDVYVQIRDENNQQYEIFGLIDIGRLSIEDLDIVIGEGIESIIIFTESNSRSSGIDWRIASVIVPSTVNNIKIYTDFLQENFKGIGSIKVDPNNPFFTSEDGLILSKDKKVLRYIDYNMEELIVPDTVETLDLSINTSDSHPGKLNRLTIPDTVKSIKALPYEDLVIYGNTGSVAEIYAISHGIDFISTGVSSIFASEEQIQVLQDQLDGITDQLSGHEETVTDLQSAVDLLEGQLADISEEITELSGISENITELTETINDMKDALDACASLDDITDLAARVASLESDISDLSDEMHLIQSTLQTAIQKVASDLTTEVAARREAIASLQTAINNLDDTYATDEKLTEAIGKAEQDLALAKEALDAVDASNLSKIEQNASAISEAKTALNVINGDGDTEGSLANILKQAINYTDTQISIVSELISDQNDALNTLQGIVDDIGADEIKSQIADMIDDIDELAGSVNDLREAYDTCASQDDIIDLVTRIASLESDISDLSDEMHLIQSTLQTAIQKVASDLTTEIAAREGAIASLQTAINNLDDTYATDEKLTEAIGKAEQDLALAREALDAVDASNLSKIEQNASAISEAKAALNVINGDADTEGSLANIMKQTKTYVDSKASELSNSISELSGKMQTAEDAINTINEENSDLKGKIAGLIEELEQAESDLADVKDSLNEDAEDSLASKVIGALAAITELNGKVDNISSEAEASINEIISRIEAIEKKNKEQDEELTLIKNELNQAKIDSLDINLSAKVKDLETVQLSWNTTKAKINDITVQYEIYVKKATDKEYTLIGTVSKGAYTTSGLTTGTLYSYYIVPVAGEYKGNDSNIASVKPLPARVTLKSVKAGKKKLTAKWTSLTKVTGYQLSYKTGSKTKYKLINGTSKVKYTLKKLKAGKKYTIRIRAYKKIGNKKVYGSWSNAKKVKIK